MNLIVTAARRSRRAPSASTVPSLAWLLLLVLFGVLVLVEIVHAQDGFSAESLAPAPARPGGLVSVWGATPLEQARFLVSLDGSYGRRPLSVNDADGERVADLIGSMSTLELVGGVGIVDRLDLTLALRMHRVAHGTELGQMAPPGLRAATLPESEVAFGDVGVTPRVALLRPSAKSGEGFALALLLPVWLPTGDDEVYAGEGVRIEPRIALEHRFRSVGLGLNVGYLVRPEAQLLGQTIDDMAVWGLGASIDLAREVELVGEVNGRLALGTNDFGADDAPTELLAALRWHDDRWLAQLGGGPGLVGGLAEPVFRVIGAVTFVSAPPTRRSPDRDRDGLSDELDRCPDHAEDRDGFEDDDGCPDEDNDRDGVLDAVDRCPEEAEDGDGFEDDDGCPDPDDDGDGVLDALDACRNESGVDDPYPAKRGCPPDRDGDSIVDASDACPDVAGVASTEPAANGCPPDGDGDGVLDSDARSGASRCVGSARIELDTSGFSKRCASSSSTSRLLLQRA
jgi:hypothetical protein